MMRRIVLVAAVFAVGLVTGCSTVGPVARQALGTAGFSYGAGRATQEFAFPSATVRTALQSAMDDLRIRSVRETHDSGLVILNGTTVDDRGATVTLRPNRGVTRVSVRIGWFGDEPLSKALLDRLGVRLGTLPPTAIPVEPPSEPDPNPFLSRGPLQDSPLLREQAEARYRDTTVP